MSETDDNATYDTEYATPYNTEIPEEEVAAEEEIKNPYVLYFAWGLLHVWMSVFGFLVFNWYPGMMSSNTWWAMQCPVTAWTSTTLALAVTAKTVGNSNTPTALVPSILLLTNVATA